jgi:prepilin-type N-terminal cleavage/methylation domain-containing protein
MKTSGSESAFTLLELLVVVFIIAVLVAMLLPASANRGRRSTAIACLSNQRQVAMGLVIFTDDHAGKYPWQVSEANGGSMELAAGNQAYPHYRAVSNYFSGQTRLLVCPTDNARKPATNFSQLTDSNISYFLSLDAGTNAGSILGGDRHLEAGGKNVGPGSFIYSTNLFLNWTHELHGKIQNGPLGVLIFADGHGQVVRNKDLNPLFQSQPLADTERLIIP